MAYVLASITPSPGRVHQNARAFGPAPCWIRLEYQGGLWRKDHYRICSFCGGIHPGDLIELLLAGQSRLEGSSKPGKHILITPNPIAGDLARMGSMPGPIFDRAHWPANLRSQLRAPARKGLNPSMAERLAGHFDRPCLELAPATIEQAFFIDHTTEPQWAEIEAAAQKGESRNVASLSSA